MSDRLGDGQGNDHVYDNVEDGIPSAPNPNRAPTVELTDSNKLFRDKTQLLGSAHHVGDVRAPCGAECPHRLHSITCPFFLQPCLVGCTVKQVLMGEGLQYEDLDLFVVSQSGQWLIGEEIMINMSQPRATRIRILRDKQGRQVIAGGGLKGSLLDDLDEFSEVELNDGQPLEYGFRSGEAALQQRGERTILHPGKPGEHIASYDLRDPERTGPPPGAGDDEGSAAGGADGRAGEETDGADPGGQPDAADPGAGAPQGDSRAGDEAGGDGLDAARTREEIPAEGPGGADAEG